MRVNSLEHRMFKDLIYIYIYSEKYANLYKSINIGTAFAECD